MINGEISVELTYEIINDTSFVQQFKGILNILDFPGQYLDFCERHVSFMFQRKYEGYPHGKLYEALFDVWSIGDSMALTRIFERGS